MKNRKQKKAFGGKIENPNTALVRNQIALANAEAEGNSNPWVIGLNALGTAAMQYGTSMMSSGVANGEASAEGASGLTKALGNNQGSFNSLLGLIGSGSQFANGGTVGAVPVEVEGQEVAETPNGDLLNFVGPTHEAGGIDTVLPQGTEVYSDRISKDGKTMAERKKNRERLESKLEKKSSDTLMFNALKRVKTKNAQEDAVDKNIQSLVDNFEGTSDKKAWGGTVGDPPKKTYQDILNEAFAKINSSFNIPSEDGLIEDTDLDELVIEVDKPKPLTPVTALTPPTTNMNVQQGVIEPITTPNLATSVQPKTTSTSPNFSMPNMTLGDIIGIGGNMYNAIEGRNNTERNRAGDTPNINAFADFGVDGLNALQQSMGYVQGLADEAKMDIRTSGNTARKSNRNTARGVNTQRALDLATYANEADANNKVTANQADQMMQILQAVSQAENIQDQVVMQGEAVRDMNDRKDRDAYFKNRASDIKTMGSAVTQTGNALNNAQERQSTTDLLNSMSPYAKVDEQGNISYKDIPKTMASKVKAENRKLLTDEQIGAGQWSEVTNPQTGNYFQSEAEYKLYRIAVQQMNKGTINVDKIPTNKETKKSK